MPGFMHRKGEPFEARILSLCDGSPYKLAEFQSAFAIDLDSEQTAPCPRSQPTRTAPQRHPRTLGRIPEGSRNTELFSRAKGFVRRGFNLRQTTIRVQRINIEHCRPPLCVEEVEGIGSRAVAYGSVGFAMLPHKLLDSQEWKALPPCAHDVVLMAYRRYDGTDAGIALTWEDFHGMRGFAKKDTFYKHRLAAVQAGILQLVCRGGNAQTGRKPDLFTIVPQWLHAAPVLKK